MFMRFSSICTGDPLSAKISQLNQCLGWLAVIFWGVLVPFRHRNDNRMAASFGALRPFLWWRFSPELMLHPLAG